MTIILDPAPESETDRTCPRVTQPVGGAKTTENLDSKDKVINSSVVTTDPNDDSVTTVTRDSKGDVINSSVATTDPNDRSVTTVTRDSKGDVINSSKATTDPNDDSVTTKHYNASGNVMKTVTNQKTNDWVVTRTFTNPEDQNDYSGETTTTLGGEKVHDTVQNGKNDDLGVSRR